MRVSIAKLPSQNISQVVRFKFPLRDISLRTSLQLFDLQKSVNIFFLNTYVDARFVQWRWSESLWRKSLLCRVTVAKRSIFCDETFCLNKLNYIRTAVHGHSQFSLKCRLPNRIRFDVFDQCFCKIETRAYETLHSFTKRLGGPRGHDVARGLSFISFRPVHTPQTPVSAGNRIFYWRNVRISRNLHKSVEHINHSRMVHELSSKVKVCHAVRLCTFAIDLEQKFPLFSMKKIICKMPRSDIFGKRIVPVSSVWLQPWTPTYFSNMK